MKKEIIALSMLTALHASAQQKDSSKPAEKETTTAAPSKDKMQAYDKVITPSTTTKSGMFFVHFVDNKYYFEIPDSLMNRDILAVTRYVATPEGGQMYGGEKANEQTIYFEKGIQGKIFLRVNVVRSRAKDENQAIYKAIQNTTVRPIAAAFDIKTINPANGNVVIDVTDFFKKENAVVTIAQDIKTEKKLGGLADDRSFITSIKTFPINIEIRSLKTYTSSNPGLAASAASGVVSLELNTSLVLLPKVPMRKRLFDERVGYFANNFVLFDDNSQQTNTYGIIQRYRLEPKEEDIEKYKRGELVEPKKQIVYYIDPATPAKWRPYLMAGVNDWQKAFEQAGFKNAIVAKAWPSEDTTMSMEDARFSVIRYFASEIPNAYGPRISDPRSGEIIESHVGWYHNVMKLVHDWYMVQVGPNDARARKMEFDDELMGELIRFVSSHEIGHTLGLRHNMGASSQTPVEKLRDKKWVEANGHTVSIMDYARFNYVAQPEDKIGKDGLYPRIGAYDKWAIQWGYKNIFNTNDEFEDKKVLNKWIVDSLNANPRLWFGGEGKNGDPRSQTEDLGDNSVKASDYGLLNLQRVMSNLLEWTKEEGDLYDNLKRMYKATTGQYSRYLYHVLTNINGTYITFKSQEQNGAVYTPVPKERMQEAIDYVGRNLMNPPLWLYPENITNKLRVFPFEEIGNVQNNVLNTLLSPGMLYNVMQINLQDPKAYTVTEYLLDVKKAAWQKFTGDKVLDAYRRNIQKMYLERIAMIYKPVSIDAGKMLTNAERSDARIYVQEHLLALKRQIQASPAANALNQLHNAAMIKEIDRILKSDSK
ncbi:uncharacterized protein DUF5118 [Chitinophaga skermanii]|uniref:Uncharacterized protein DUF5118 n=1 Tax=Chitinophaga skermanii TaxID=331697 RepID=A0A327R4A2_9BACT|nr:zinc-dependent metalloprotease [Chitinophaga skermanii]RAJ08707.1 uncharacterized protein DUF5118 [Chitinophaga skermanii]